VVVYKVLYSKIALKDAKKLTKSNLHLKAQALIEIIKINPYQNPPPYEKLIGNLDGATSRRINVQHRLVYQVHQSDKVIRILRMWSHYGD